MRFPEFKGEWNKTEIANIISNKSAKYIPNTLEHILDIELENMNEGGGITTNLSDSANQRSTKNCFYIGNVLFGKLRPYLNKIWLASKKGVCSSEIWVLSSDTLVPSFLYSFCQTSHFSHLANTTCGSKMPRADWDLMSSSLINYPSMDEQKKIGNLLITLEKRICLQRKTIEDLEKVCLFQSDGLLKLDPIVGTPLSKILFETNKYAKKDEGFVHVTLSKEGITPKTDRYNRDFLVKSEDKKYKITELNDICYNPANLKFGVISLNLFGKAIFSPIYVTFKVKEGYSPFFISLLLTNQRFINYIRRYEQGTVYERMAVNPSDFLKAKLVIPDFKRQIVDSKKIEILKEKIIKEKEILSALIMVKKYLLSHLFI